MFTRHDHPTPSWRYIDADSDTRSRDRLGRTFGERHGGGCRAEVARSASFQSRGRHGIERPDGKTSPEELIAAAHASCFAMAPSLMLGENRTPPERLVVNE